MSTPLMTKQTNRNEPMVIWHLNEEMCCVLSYIFWKTFLPFLTFSIVKCPIGMLMAPFK